MKHKTENELATRTAMHNKQDFEKKKKRAWRRNPPRRSSSFSDQKSNLDLQAIADMWDTASSLKIHKTEKYLLSLPLGIANDRNGPLTGRKPGSKKNISLTPKSRATGRERDRYCKSSYWKQQVYNINYSRMQKTRPRVQVWMGYWGQGLLIFSLFDFCSASGFDGEII